MKKQVKRLLSVGLCLALGLSVGGGLAACKDSGEGTTPPDTSPSPYYLAGSGNVFLGTATGEGDAATGGEWYEKYTDAESVPDAIHFVRSETDGNIHTLTADLYVDDEFGILTVGKGWGGQMGYNIVAENENEYFVEGGGFTPKNIKVAEAGNYTITLTVSDGATTLTYERNGDAPKLPVAVTGVTLDKTSLTLEVGAEATLTATVAPEDADDKTVTWTSDKKDVATVVNGKVTAVAAGEATITATAGGKSATCKVVVAAAGSIVEVTGVTLDKTAATVNAGTPVTLTATVAPENATNKAVTWASSDEKIATVDENGKVTAVKPGTATITATAGGDKTAECEVTVPDGYYLFGKFNEEFGAGEWADLTGKLNEMPASIVFVQDAENADKYTLEGVFNRGDQIKILPMSGPDKNWTNVIGLGQLDDENNKFSDGGGGNIKFLDSAKYKLTLEKAEGNMKLLYEILEDVDDVTYEAYKVEVWGTGNSWASAYAEKTVDAVTATEQWKAEITLTLAADEVFQFRQIYGTPAITNYIGAGQGVNGSNASGELFANDSNNYKCVTAGTYKFTLQFNEFGECESVTAVAVTE